jgi:hypothetical protein
LSWRDIVLIIEESPNTQQRNREIYGCLINKENKKRDEVFGYSPSDFTPEEMQEVRDNIIPE